MPAPHVDLRDLMQITDAGGYSRGLAYFREGNVLDLIWHEDRQELEAYVKGSRDALRTDVIDAEQFCGFTNQERTDAFTAFKRGIAHGFDQQIIRRVGFGQHRFDGDLDSGGCVGQCGLKFG